MVEQQIWEDLLSQEGKKSFKFNSKEYCPELYLTPYHISTMELFAKIVNGLQSLTTSSKSSILDVWQASEYASAVVVFFLLTLSTYVLTVLL